MHLVLILLLTCLPTALQAQVFKCTDNTGKTIYQSTSCQASTAGQQLNIKTDPNLEAKAKAKYNALEAEYETKKAEQLKTEQQAAQQRMQAEQVDALKRSAAAQQQQAIALQRQADELAKQKQLNNRPLLYVPPISPLPNTIATPNPQQTQQVIVEHQQGHHPERQTTTNAESMPGKISNGNIHF